MTAVEDRLAEIEARFADAVSPEDGQEHATACASARDVRPLLAALRAVEGEAHPGNLIISNAAWVAGYQDAMSDVRRSLAAALDVTP